MKKSLFVLLLFPHFSFSQNVGIGTPTPLAKLHVSGTGNELAIFSGASTGMYITLAEGANNRGYIGSYYGNPEDVDFGTHSSNSTGKLHLVTGSTSRLTVTPTGNVGIRTINPQAALDVNGDVIIRNRILLNNDPGTAGQVLVSGGAGNASWKSTAYNNSDRFLFEAIHGLNSSSSAFNGYLNFITVYTKSNAITYNNTVFTVNKTGLYKIEGMIRCLATTNSATALCNSLVHLESGGIIYILNYGKLDNFREAAGLHDFSNFSPFSTSLHLEAGATIRIKAAFSANGTLHSSGFAANLSINLIAE